MYVYAGIDEAGYGPMFGPLVIGRSVFRIPKLECDSPPPHLWQRLSKAVGRRLADRRGRIIVNDSKMLTTKAAGIKHLERGCLGFARLAEQSRHRLGGLDHAAEVEASAREVHVGHWLEAVGSSVGQRLAPLPWYASTTDRPWETLPRANTCGELGIDRSMLRRTCERIGVEVASLRAAVVLENDFNRLVREGPSKAAVTWRFVAKHLQTIWESEGHHEPTVMVDRLGGRTDYRPLLAQTFPDAALTVLSQSPGNCGYRLRTADRSMTIWFRVNAESAHMPVALASMTAKYTRELLMARFQDYFAHAVPEVKPTAGYGTDGQRFWREIRPHLARLRIDANRLKRIA